MFILADVDNAMMMFDENILSKRNVYIYQTFRSCAISSLMLLARFELLGCVWMASCELIDLPMSNWYMLLNTRSLSSLVILDIDRNDSTIYEIVHGDEQSKHNRMYNVDTSQSCPIVSVVKHGVIGLDLELIQ